MEDKAELAFLATDNLGIVHRIMAVHRYLPHLKDYDLGVLVTEGGKRVLGDENLGYQIDVIPRVPLVRIP